jgi:hypothetical protein
MAEAEEKGTMEASPDAHKFFIEELKLKLRYYAIVGTVLGISTGVVNAVQKEIVGTVSPGAYVYPLFPLSSADI